MGINALNIFSNNQKWHKFSLKECAEMSKMLSLFSDYQETLEVIFDEQHKVVIAASGMGTGGRVLSNLDHYIGLPETTFIVVEYQIEGTRGRKLLKGAKEIKIHGQ